MDNSSKKNTENNLNETDLEALDSKSEPHTVLNGIEKNVNRNLLSNDKKITNHTTSNQRNKSQKLLILLKNIINNVKRKKRNTEINEDKVIEEEKFIRNAEPKNILNSIKTSAQTTDLSGDSEWFVKQYEKYVGRPTVTNANSAFVLSYLRLKSQFRFVPEKIQHSLLSYLKSKSSGDSLFLSWSGPPVPRCACPLRECFCRGDTLLAQKRLPFGCNLGWDPFYYVKMLPCYRICASKLDTKRFFEKLTEKVSNETDSYNLLYKRGILQQYGPEFCLSRCLHYMKPGNMRTTKYLPIFDKISVGEYKEEEADKLDEEEEDVNDRVCNFFTCEVSSQTDTGPDGEINFGKAKNVIFPTVKNSILSDVEGKKLTISPYEPQTGAVPDMQVCARKLENFLNIENIKNRFSKLMFSILEIKDPGVPVTNRSTQLPCIGKVCDVSEDSRPSSTFYPCGDKDFDLIPEVPWTFRMKKTDLDNLDKQHANQGEETCPCCKKYKECFGKSIGDDIIKNKVFRSLTDTLEPQEQNATSDDKYINDELKSKIINSTNNMTVSSEGSAPLSSKGIVEDKSKAEEHKKNTEAVQNDQYIIDKKLDYTENTEMKINSAPYVTIEEKIKIKTNEFESVIKNKENISNLSNKIEDNNGSVKTNELNHLKLTKKDFTSNLQKEINNIDKRLLSDSAEKESLSQRNLLDKIEDKNVKTKSDIPYHMKLAKDTNINLNVLENATNTEKKVLSNSVETGPTNNLLIKNEDNNRCDKDDILDNKQGEREPSNSIEKISSPNSNHQHQRCDFVKNRSFITQLSRSDYKKISGSSIKNKNSCKERLILKSSENMSANLNCNSKITDQIISDQIIAEPNYDSYEKQSLISNRDISDVIIHNAELQDLGSSNQRLNSYIKNIILGPFINKVKQLISESKNISQKLIIQNISRDIAIPNTFCKNFEDQVLQIQHKNSIIDNKQNIQLAKFSDDTKTTEELYDVQQRKCSAMKLKISLKKSNNLDEADKNKSSTFTSLFNWLFNQRSKYINRSRSSKLQTLSKGKISTIVNTQSNALPCEGTEVYLKNSNESEKEVFSLQYNSLLSLPQDSGKIRNSNIMESKSDDKKPN